MHDNNAYERNAASNIMQNSIFLFWEHQIVNQNGRILLSLQKD